MRDISISSYFLQAILKHTYQQGYDIPSLLNKSNIPAKLFSEPGARITSEQYASLQSRAMKAMDDEMLGYSELPVKLGGWSAVCHWMIVSPTLGLALKRYCHFFQIMERGIKTEMILSDSTLTIRFSTWTEGKILEPYAYELVMVSLHRLLCWISKERLPILGVTVSYSPPEYSSEYSQLYLRAPVEFNASECTLTMDRNFLQLPVKQTHESLREFLKQPHLNILIEDPSDKSWITKTQSLLQNDLINLPNLVDVANSLGIHPKKLRRKLNEEGISYNELKSQLRRDVAIYNLTKTDNSIEKIAYLTGFSETCTFTRAFKRWTGVTPHTYRKNPIKAPRK